MWTGVQFSSASSCHSNSSSRPIRCYIKAKAAMKQWVHKRHCCVCGHQSAIPPAGMYRRWSCRESHLTTASGAEASPPAVWSSPNVHVAEPQASEMKSMWCFKKKKNHLILKQVFHPLVLFLSEYVSVWSSQCDVTKLMIKVPTSAQIIDNSKQLFSDFVCFDHEPDLQ